MCEAVSSLVLMLGDLSSPAKVLTIPTSAMIIKFAINLLKIQLFLYSIVKQLSRITIGAATTCQTWRNAPECPCSTMSTRRWRAWSAASEQRYSINNRWSTGLAHLQFIDVRRNCVIQQSIDISESFLIQAAVTAACLAKLRRF